MKEWWRDWCEENLIILSVIVLVIIVLGIGAYQPYAEKEAFNKFSKTKATYWDAIWADLRIFPDKD